MIITKRGVGAADAELIGAFRPNNEAVREVLGK